MNGQPTAENTRECGADGDLPGFRNWQNDRHVTELADLWDVDVDRLQHDGPPTHAMEMFRLAEDGAIRMLWISATNPAVSLPELERIRGILRQERLFVVVQDIFLTETAAWADVVLPAATWGEKTGTFTNADRTVHLSEQAVDPPGDAHPDLAILLDYARRMNFRDRHGRPFPPWGDPESAFAAWKRCSAGRPCDYTGMTYQQLRGPSGVQWPCNDANPDGTDRLYADGRFWSAAGDCETYGKNVVTGEAVGPDAYRASDPLGKAMIESAEYHEPPEVVTQDFPFVLITGRTLYHFHTRTKTARAPQLDAAAPEVWVELAEQDARESDIHEGDLLEVTTRRGSVTARARITGLRSGVIFVPFHYGYWDSAGNARHARAANELTPTAWDPASKQPIFKSGAARIRRIGGVQIPAPAPTTTASAPVGNDVPATTGGPTALVSESADEGRPR